MTVIRLLNDPKWQREWIDLPIWSQLQSGLKSLLEISKPAKVVLDFAGLHKIGSQPIISSAMNNAYVRAQRFSRSFGCQWRICGLTSQARELFAFTCLGQIFPHIHDSQADALTAFGNSA
ncbi:MAG: hypothetical protein ACR2FY_04905 [Pirellulaceae bacterium]